MTSARRTFRRAVAFAALLTAAGLPSLPSAHVAVDEQVRLLDARIAADPSSATLRLERGELQRARGEWREAEADDRAALRLDPGLHAARLALGRVLLEAGRPAAALPAIERFLASRPDHALGHTLRARALLALGRTLDAATAFGRAIALAPAGRPPEPDLYLERARALKAAGAGHEAEALRGLDEGLARLGAVVSLQLEAIDLDVRLRDFDAALRRLETLEKLPGRPEPWLVRRAAILEAAGRRDEARAACEAVLSGDLARAPAGGATPLLTSLADECRTRLRRLAGPPGAAPRGPAPGAAGTGR